jgi:hypothetical protein
MNRFQVRPEERALTQKFGFEEMHEPKRVNATHVGGRTRLAVAFAATLLLTSAVQSRARESELAAGLETRLHSAVRDWIAKEWPFAKVAFPGRDIDWEAWQAIPDEPR